jgi:hypothetical protein
VSKYSYLTDGINVREREKKKKEDLKDALSLLFHID